jgi:ribosome-associated toxin RatA of RatAB toxin-antitoxin module
MATAEIKEVLSVNKDKLWDAIVRYEDYPSFVEGAESVEVQRKGAGKARAKYHVSMMKKDINYTLDHVENKDTGVIEWTLVESDFFKKNSGRWTLKAAGADKTEITYSLDVDFKISVPGFILNPLIKSSLPAMVKSFEKQAKKSK